MMLNEEQVEILIRIDQRVERLETTVEDLLHRVVGNGREGLVTTVARLDERVGVLEGIVQQAVLSRRDRMALYGVLVAGGMGILVELYRALHGA